MNSKIKTALFAYIEAGIASAIVLAYTGGAKNPTDFLWAFLVGFAGPLVKALNPLDEAFGLRPIKLPDAPHGTAQQEKIAATLADAATTALEDATAPVVDQAVNAVAPTVEAVADVVAPIVDTVTKPQ